jgi:hypothetical protein
VKGDFSRWQFHARDNFNGVLPQQGKLLIDADGIAQTRITNHWEQTAARDWVGPVAAVPATEPDAFAITRAVNLNGTVTFTVGTGRLWADGMLVQLGDTGTVQRTATSLEPPIVPTPGGTPAGGDRDVVVLEVWQEGVNGYQMPQALIEPALGGPDTAERVHTGMAFRLVRLTVGQNCKNIDYDASLGKLTATLQPVTTIKGDCPIPVGGGYSGFEHRLYRVEIADVKPNGLAVFKWSRENGGLVGRGTFDPATGKIEITANLVAITTANQPSFYVEIEHWDSERGSWQVACGANATLNVEALQFSGPPAFGGYPAKGDVFFRLWDGTAPVSTFPVAANPNQLENGIFLQFDAEAPGLYRPRDYWVFPVRAGGISNPQTLLDHRRPEGIVYHRVPLAEITWDNTGKSAQHIEDCRAVIHPLTERRGCCTRQVGDGVASFGEYTSIQAAIESLPPEGGEVCVLAGRYFEPVTIQGRTNVSVHGCGHHTRIASPSLGRKKQANAGSVILVTASQDVEIRSLVVEADDGDIGIEVAAFSTRTTSAEDRPLIPRMRVTDVRMRDLIVIASTEPGVSVEQARDVVLDKSIIAMRDVASKSAAVFVSGQEIHVTSNWVGPATAAILPAIVINDYGFSTRNGTALSILSGSFFKAPCGIQIGGTSRDVYICWNEIERGRGNGITLGSVILVDGNGDPVNGPSGTNPGRDPQNPCAGGDLLLLGRAVLRGRDVSTVVEGRLSGIHIESNRIRYMGLCGIGPVGFFDLSNTQEIVTVQGLWIISNEIDHCLSSTLNRVSDAQRLSTGYGGICLPDVSQAFIRDNFITNTGATLAGPVCGIFILHGIEVEISRNEILDLRTYTTEDVEQASGLRAGIEILVATPPEAPGMQLVSKNVLVEFSQDRTVYAQGVPALCIQENVVNIPSGQALIAEGLGAFSVRGNHFATGGAVAESSGLARCVAILSAGTAPESTVYNRTAYLKQLNNPTSGAAAGSQMVDMGSVGLVRNVAPGPLLFSENRCSVEERFTTKSQVSSVLIVSYDDLGFHDNQCWMETTANVQAHVKLKSSTLRVTGCRFQEKAKLVQFSLLSAASRNIISLNEATHEIFAAASSMLKTIVANNIIG